MRTIYLDYNSTTPVDPVVLETMLPWFTDRFWNAASSHPAGEAARRAVEHGRAQTADLIGARASELVLTSGSTESNNLALKGALAARRNRRRVLVSATEHKAVLDSANWLSGQGYDVRLIPVRGDGSTDVTAVRALMSDDVALVSVMLANNETGVIQPLRDIADVAHEAGALVHTDATQAVGKIAVDVEDLDVDLLSLSAHKFYGPKGVGALHVRRGLDVEAQMHGGGHEHGLRSGTLNVPGVVGMGSAAALAADQLAAATTKSESLVQRLLHGLREQLSCVSVVTGDALRLPNTVNVRFAGADAEAVMTQARNVCISSGSACTSRVPEPSHVLLAMGFSRDEAYECLRFSVGRMSTKDEIDVAGQQLTTAVSRVRELTGHTTDPVLAGGTSK